MTNRIVRFVLSAALAVAAISPLAEAGVAGGPVQADTTVTAHGRLEFRPILFVAGERATVLLKGDGDTDLDVYIYDNNGNLITKDDDGTDTCLAMWTPRWTGYFTIVVRNRGSVYNRFQMATN